MDIIKISWLESARTDRYGILLRLNLFILSSCDQLVTSSSHPAGETLDLVVYEVPVLILFLVVAPTLANA